MFKSLWLYLKVRKLNKKYYPVESFPVTWDYSNFHVSFTQNGNGDRKVHVRHERDNSYRLNRFKKSNFMMMAYAWRDGNSNVIPTPKIRENVVSDTHYTYYHYRGTIFRKEVKDSHNAGINVEVVDSW